MTESRPEWPGADTLSISIGMVFYSNITSRHARVHMMNHMLRTCGLNPTEPGTADGRDHIKAICGRSLWPFWRRGVKLIGSALSLGR